MKTSVDVDAQRFAALVPVASDAIGLARGAALIQSLFQWEPNIRWCLILDDSPRPSGLENLSWIPSTCNAIEMPNERCGVGQTLRGGLTARLLKALSWIHSHTDAEYVLRIDADALVIGSFARFVRSFATQRRDAGLIGTIGLSCNPVLRALQDINDESQLVRVSKLIPRDISSLGWLADRCLVPGVGHLTETQFRAFDAIRPHIEAAVRNGYTTSEFCQGGAYVMTRQMLDRMAASGYFEEPDAWLHIPFSEDRVMAMYAWALGMRIYDCSHVGEPFGMNFRGLAFPPEQLVARGHSLIHSVKNDPHLSEMAIRQFFLNRLTL